MRGVSMFRFFFVLFVCPVLVLAGQSANFTAAFDARLAAERSFHDERVDSLSFVLTKRADSLESLLSRGEQHRLSEMVEARLVEDRLSVRLTKKVMNLVYSSSNILNFHAYNLANRVIDDSQFVSSAQSNVVRDAGALKSEAGSWFSNYFKFSVSDKDPSMQLLRLMLLLVCAALVLFCLKRILQMAAWFAGWVILLSLLGFACLVLWTMIDAPGWDNPMFHNLLLAIKYAPVQFILSVLVTVFLIAFFFKTRVKARGKGMSLTEYSSIRVIDFLKWLFKGMIRGLGLFMEKFPPAMIRATKMVLLSFLRAKEVGWRSEVKGLWQNVKRSGDTQYNLIIFVWLIGTVIWLSLKFSLIIILVEVFVFIALVFTLLNYLDARKIAKRDGNSMRGVLEDQLAKKPVDDSAKS
jgi:hypothetical protein